MTCTAENGVPENPEDLDLEANMAGAYVAVHGKVLQAQVCSLGGGTAHNDAFQGGGSLAAAHRRNEAVRGGHGFMGHIARVG